MAEGTFTGKGVEIGKLDYGIAWKKMEDINKIYKYENVNKIIIKFNGLRLGCYIKLMNNLFKLRNGALIGFLLYNV